MTKGDAPNDTFPITHQLLFIKEEMPEAETTVLLVEEEYEQSQ